MALEVLKVLVVVEGVVADRIVLFRGGMEDCGMPMCKAGQVYAVLLGVQCLVVSVGVWPWSVAAHNTSAPWNLLAGFAAVQTEGLVLRRGDEQVATVVKAEPCDLPDVGGMLCSVWERPWGWWRCWFDGLLVDLCWL